MMTNPYSGFKHGRSWDEAESSTFRSPKLRRVDASEAMFCPGGQQYSRGNQDFHGEPPGDYGHKEQGWASSRGGFNGDNGERRGAAGGSRGRGRGTGSMSSRHMDMASCSGGSSFDKGPIGRARGRGTGSTISRQTDGSCSGFEGTGAAISRLIEMSSESGGGSSVEKGGTGGSRGRGTSSTFNRPIAMGSGSGSSFERGGASGAIAMHQEQDSTMGASNRGGFGGAPRGRGVGYEISPESRQDSGRFKNGGRGYNQNEFSSDQRGRGWTGARGGFSQRGGGRGEFSQHGGGQEGISQRGGGQAGISQRGRGQGGFSQPGGGLGVFSQPVGGRGGISQPGGVQGGFSQPSGGRGGFSQPSGERGGFSQPSGERGGFSQPSGERGGFSQPGGGHRGRGGQGRWDQVGRSGDVDVYVGAPWNAVRGSGGGVQGGDQGRGRGGGQGGSSQPGVVQGGSSQPGGGRGGFSQPSGVQGGFNQPSGGRGGISQPGGVQGGLSQPGTGRGGYSQPGGVQGGFSQPGAERGGLSQPSGVRGGFSQPGGVQGGFSQPGGERGGFSQPGGGRGGFSQPSGVQGGFSQPGGERGGFSQPGGERGGLSQPGGVRGGFSQPGGERGGFSQPGTGRGGFNQVGHGGDVDVFIGAPWSAGRGRGVGVQGGDQGRGRDVGQGGFSRPGTGRGGFSQPGVERGGFSQPGTGRGGFSQPSGIQGGFSQPGVVQGGISQPSGGRGGFSQPGTGRGVFSQPGGGQRGRGAQGHCDQGGRGGDVDLFIGAPWSAGRGSTGGVQGGDRGRGRGVGQGGFSQPGSRPGGISQPGGVQGGFSQPGGGQGEFSQPGGVQGGFSQPGGVQGGFSQHGRGQDRFSQCIEGQRGRGEQGRDQVGRGSDAEVHVGAPSGAGLASGEGLRGEEHGQGSGDDSTPDLGEKVFTRPNRYEDSILQNLSKFQENKLPIEERFVNLCKIAKPLLNNMPTLPTVATKLEEVLLSDNVCLTPSYVFKGQRAEENQPYKCKVFRCKVYFNDIFIVCGLGESTRKAKNKACQLAIKVLGSKSAQHILTNHEKVKVTDIGKDDADIVECPVRCAESNIGIILSVPDSNEKKSWADFYIKEPEEVDETSCNNSTGILRQSADFSKLLLTFDFATSHQLFLCTVTMAGKILATATAVNHNKAKNLASEAALQKLRQTNWTIQVIKRDKPTPAAKPLTATFGRIRPNDPRSREQFTQNLRDYLRIYFAFLDDHTKWLPLSQELNKAEREAVSDVAKEMNLRMESKRVDGKQRKIEENDPMFLVLSKKLLCQDLFDYIWQQGGETWRYKLKAPGEFAQDTK